MSARIAIAGGLGALALLAGGTGSRAASAPPATSGAPVVAAYFADYDSGYNAAQIPAGTLTDVIYAFAAATAEGRCALGDPYADVIENFPGPRAGSGGLHGNFGQLAGLEARYPGLETEISIGGWGGSGRFSQVAATAASRDAFVSSCIKLFLLDYPGLFDGIDIDWEFPVEGGAPTTPARPADRANATLLLAEFRSQLNALGVREHRHYLLTAALPAGRFLGRPGYTPQTSWDLSAVAQTVDWINVMTFDMTNNSSPVTNFDSPLGASATDPTPAAIKQWNNVAAVVRFYEQNGVPPSKIVLGNAFYGHTFTHVPDIDHGLFQRFRALGPAPTYPEIVADYLPSSRQFWDPSAQEPWLYDHATRTFISYEDPRSLRAKASYVVAQHLRGVMIWEISMDDTGHSLLDALADPLLTAAAARDARLRAQR